MPWCAWVSVGLNVVLAAAAWHHWDVAKAQTGLARYWHERYDRKRAKYRRPVESMVTKSRGRHTSGA